MERVEKVLRLNGLVHRFVPEKTPGRPDQPMGDCEGAFLMCTMWLAEAWQMLGEPERAKRALERAEAARGILHHADVFRLTDASGLFEDPERAASRVRAFRGTWGIPA